MLFSSRSRARIAGETRRMPPFVAETRVRNEPKESPGEVGQSGQRGTVGRLLQMRLLERFRAVRGATLGFCGPLSAEDMMVQSSAETSPAKWHLAHTSWFFETFVLLEFRPGYKPFRTEFKWLFNSYYNGVGEMPEKRLRASFSRPGLEEVQAYRAHVDREIEALLAGGPAAVEAVRRIALGLEHEQQHLELLATDVKHAFWTNPLHPAYRELVSEVDAGVEAEPVGWVQFAPGLVEVGVSPAAESAEAFAFDNETPRHRVYLEPFRLANRPVTCAEYLRFIEADGYRRPELWLSEGWTTMRSEAWEAPLYWRRGSDGGWEVFTLGGFRPMEEMRATPVCHVSFFEADAFARWSGCRLPTEFEWEFAAVLYASKTIGNFLESGAFHPVAAGMEPGLQQMFGDVWEWTSSPYTGYPGYRPLPGALGEYNGKFMSSQVVLRGGSCATPREHIRATYRNFFGPATRWQFSGLRLARDGDGQ